MSRYRVVRSRRWLAKTLRRAHLYQLAATVNPGPRVRLWDSEWNLRADSDREPSTTVRWSGRFA